MDSPTVVDLNWAAVRRWHKQNLSTTQALATDCNRVIQRAGDADDIVRKLIANHTVRAKIGIPTKGLKLVKKPASHWDQWLLQLWGRKCHYYISTLVAGLLSTTERFDRPELGNLVDELKTRADGLRDFVRWHTNLSPESTLISIPDVDNFHVTHFDPRLFTALYILYQDPHTKTSGEAYANLLRIIYDEVDKYTDKGTRMRRDLIADEATVWWGLKALVEHIRHLPSPKDNSLLRKLANYPSAADVCVNLITYKQPSFPSKERSWVEGTAEIYGATRTRILIAKNCAELIGMFRQNGVSERIPTLVKFLRHEFHEVQKRTAEIAQHMTLLGLSLEMSSALLKLGGAATPGAPSTEAPVTVGRHPPLILVGKHQVKVKNATYFSLLRIYAEIRQQADSNPGQEEMLQRIVTLLQKLREDQQQHLGFDGRVVRSLNRAEDILTLASGHTKRAKAVQWLRQHHSDMRRSLDKLAKQPNLDPESSYAATVLHDGLPPDAFRLSLKDVRIV